MKCHHWKEIQWKPIQQVYLRDGDLRGSVVVETEGATLQNFKAKALTLISVYIHWHDCQRELPSILNLETLSDGEERLVGAQACNWQAPMLNHLWFGTTKVFYSTVRVKLKFETLILPSRHSIRVDWGTLKRREAPGLGSLPPTLSSSLAPWPCTVFMSNTVRLFLRQLKRQRLCLTECHTQNSWNDHCSVSSIFFFFINWYSWSGIDSYCNAFKLESKALVINICFMWGPIKC